jgi:hypothetical protein
LIPTAGHVIEGRMNVAIGTLVMLPGYAPYPRYGHVMQVDDGRVHVTHVHCGDPRCAAEHRHGDVVWPLEELRAVHAYQPRAGWEEGRLSSPNAVVDA